MFGVCYRIGVRRRCLGLILTVLLSMLPAAGQGLSRLPTAADRAAIVTKGWTASRDVLGVMLAKAYEPGAGGRMGTTGQTAFQSWLRLWQWCDLLARDENTEAAKFLADHLRLSPQDQGLVLVPPGLTAGAELQPAPAGAAQAMMAAAPPEKIFGDLLRADALPPQHRPLGDLVPKDVLAEWLGNEDFSRMLFANLAPDDYVPGVLRALAQIQLEQPGKFREYRALALAIALVYDQKMPAFWPHNQVAPKEVPLQDYRPVDWFAFWVQNNESKGNLVDLRSLDPEQAKFVVDAPLAPSEYAWAKANVKFARTEFAQAYSSVTYDEKRYQRGEFNWPDSPYTLAAIKQQGGICVDQAYYAMIAGKARGLPTLFFTGDGNDGGHAWFGYLKAANHWDFNCGRYENQKFATGHALDPQTWQPITDHELAFLAGNFHARPEYAASQDDLVMAGIFESQGNLTQARAALDSAIAVCPMNAGAWDAKTAFLSRTGAPVEDLRQHHVAAARQFSSEPDLKAAHLSALADLAHQSGDSAAASSLDNQIITQNQSTRADLGVDTLAKQLQVLVNNGQLDEAFKKYRQQMDGLGKNGGSDFFYKIVDPFVGALLAAGQQEHAEQAVELARAALMPPMGTTLQRDLDALNDMVLATPKKAAESSAAKP
jgi:tetratricopeptide (TPR) repeat protein